MELDPGPAGSQTSATSRATKRAFVRLKSSGHRCRWVHGGLNKTAEVVIMLFRAARFCALVVMGLVAWPVAAQQTPPDQAVPSQQTPSAAPSPPAQATQTCPDGSVISTSASCPAPPPFPPMPPRAPHHRWVDVGTGRSTHVHHHAEVRHHDHHRHAAHSRHVAADRHHNTAHLSKRTVRWCRHFSHRQMLRHSKCRTLTEQEHEAARHRHHRSSQAWRHHHHHHHDHHHHHHHHHRTSYRRTRHS